MKGKISKRLLSLILAVIMVVSVVPMGVFEAEAIDFVPRYSSPEKSGWYANYDNNCCAYAKCRANEILGRYVNLGTGGPGGYYYNLRNQGFKTGKMPRPGALAVAWFEKQ